mmetsp:Transcript_3284/g.11168  ORF Transcript_3284/g.11168 Transcript_3284/m.11168 type:complete len:154 (+) Transcript_3284:756-1217(+)
MVEQRGKILKVPPGQQFALKTFHDYVWNRVADGQPTSWIINITGKKAKETTIQMRFGKENDWKSGQVYLFFTRFLPSECLKDVRRCLKKERIGPILKKLPIRSLEPLDDALDQPGTVRALPKLPGTFTRVPGRSELAQQLQRRHEKESGLVYR